VQAAEGEVSSHDASNRGRTVDGTRTPQVLSHGANKQGRTVDGTRTPQVTSHGANNQKGARAKEMRSGEENTAVTAMQGQARWSTHQASILHL